MQRRRNLDPYRTVARYDGKCAETGKPYRKGDPIIYYPRSRSAYVESSKQAEEFRALQASAALGLADANW